MLQQVSFQNFKAIGEAVIPLHPLTVFAGPNGAGKTSILQGVYYLSQAVWLKSLDEFFSGDRQLDRLWKRGADAPLRIEFLLDGARVALTPQPGRGHAAKMKLLGEGRESPFFSISPLSKPELEAQVQKHLNAFSPAVYFASGTLSGNLADAARRFDPPLYLEGDGLASMLVFLRLNAPDLFAQIEDAMRRIFPKIEQIRFERAYKQQTPELWVRESLLFDAAGSRGVPAAAMSEGEMRTLSMLTALIGARPEPPRLFLADAIDQALHPAAQVRLMEVLRELLQTRPELQILASSHSPAFLDLLEVDEVRLTNLGDDGEVRAARLQEHPEFEKHRDQLKPGEFWRMMGESWFGPGRRELAR